MRPAWNIAFTVVILAVSFGVAAAFGPPASFVFVVLGLAGIGLLWLAAYRNGGALRAAETRIKAAHPGAAFERVNLWLLPSGRVGRLGPHAILADPTEIQFVTYDDKVLATVPVVDIDLLDVLTAQGDRARDKAVTILYGDPQQTVQFFTLTHLSQDLLAERVRKWTELGDRARP